MTLGDLDEDGDAELVMLVSAMNPQTGMPSVTVRTLSASDDGTWGWGPSRDVPGESNAVLVADLNDDGHLDLAVASYSGFQWLPGAGNGTFGQTESIPMQDVSGTLVARDLDGDRDTDLVASTAEAVTVVLNQGNGDFAKGKRYEAGGGANSIAVGDWDRDGRLDLAVATWRDQVCVLLGQGDGRFGAPTPYHVGNGIASVVAADLDRDGDLDLAVTNQNADSIAVLFGRGDGTFIPEPRYDAGEFPQSAVAPTGMATDWSTSSWPIRCPARSPCSKGTAMARLLNPNTSRSVKGSQPSRLQISTETAAWTSRRREAVPGRSWSCGVRPMARSAGRRAMR